MDKISILGYGKSGRAAADLAASMDYSVSVFDEKLPQDCLPHNHEMAESTLIVTSPGIPLKSDLMKKAIDTKIPIISELEFGFRHCKCPIIAITGTNGKTTTTELMAHLLREVGIKADVSGNIGIPLCESVKSSSFHECLVVEVSSFQLERCDKFCPKAAAILNITPDHLDRYESFEEYAAVKFRIFKNMTEENNLVINEILTQYWNKHVPEYLSPHTFSSMSENADFFYKKGIIYFSGIKGVRPLINMADTSLQGVHNAENIMASLALLCSFFPADALFNDRVKDAISSFGTGPHRIETIAESDDVRYINDSKATNPDAVVVALRTVGGTSNVCLILGGLDKDMDFSLIRAEASRIKTAFIMGECKNKISAALSDIVNCQLFNGFDEAVTAACEEAKSGDVVLLAPACASMDMFKNYMERGNRFRSIVDNWLRSQR
ncbi:MAG: UDP-N-acetylmuramoylalanine--D-glutamate ligase [Lentisphaerae bacterium GWF2_44_16]|nr:MAG: UDP-N-acetylmuramoylalanine--D-glutamate ligase [Lentisphaerae bacterium GWF2_44_16]